MSLGLFVVFGAIGLAIALAKTQKLIKSKFIQDVKEWIVIKYFLIIFIIGYIVIFILVLFKNIDIIYSLVGIIFLLGALFVYNTVRTGYRTVRQLHYTRVSKKYVDKIIDSMADTLIVLNVGPDLRITKVNKAILNLLDYSKDEIIGQPLENIIKSNEKIEYFIKQCESEEWLTNEEAFYYSKNGKKIPVLLSFMYLE